MYKNGPKSTYGYEMLINKGGDITRKVIPFDERFQGVREILIEGEESFLNPVDDPQILGKEDVNIDSELNKDTGGLKNFFRGGVDIVLDNFSNKV